jgi:hypothetical protein
MTPREFFARYRLYRRTRKHDDFRAALICSVVAGAMGATKEGSGRAFEPWDFMMALGHGQKPVDNAAVRQKALAFAAAYGLPVIDVTEEDGGYRAGAG